MPLQDLTALRYDLAYETLDSQAGCCGVLCQPFAGIMLFCMLLR